MFPAKNRDAAYGENEYRPKMRRQVYSAMHEQASELLAQKSSVVLDGTYLTAELRSEAAEIAARHGATFVSIRCECPDDVARERIRCRAGRGEDASDARPDFVSSQRQADEQDVPYANDATPAHSIAAHSIAVDTSSDSIELQRAIYDVLRKICFRSPPREMA